MRGRSHLVSLLLVALLPACSAGGDEAADAFPSFTLASLREGGGEVSDDDLAGKPAVVNFFASWCTPCKRELPLLAETARRYEGRVTFLGIDHEDSRTEGAELLERYDIPYEAGYDPEGTVRAQLPQKGLPVTVFVTRDGTITSLKLGELKASDLTARIDQLLEKS